MSDTLIVYAHPNHDGHCGYYLQELQRELARRNEPGEVLDLYALGFDPVLKADEHYGSNHRNVAPGTRELQEKVRQAKRLIFIYPVWWQNVPAILKGFVDRVFTPGFAFEYQANGFPRGLLPGRRAAVFACSGAPRIFAKLVARDRALHVMVKDTLKFCGLRAKGFAIGGAGQLTPKNQTAIAKTVQRGLRFLFADT